MNLQHSICAALLCLTPAAVGANHLNHGAQVGLYEGHLTFDDGGIEPIVIRFDSDHGVTVISELETVERETPGFGHWQRHQGNTFAFGYLSFREGSGWICTGFDDTAPLSSCTLVGTAIYTLRQGELNGSLTITIKDRADGGGNYTVGPFPMKAYKRTISDLEAMHE